MKRFLSLVVVTLMTLSLFTACSTNENVTNEKAKTIGLAISTLKCRRLNKPRR